MKDQIVTVKLRKSTKQKIDELVATVVWIGLDKLPTDYRENYEQLQPREGGRVIVQAVTIDRLVSCAVVTMHKQLKKRWVPL